MEHSWSRLRSSHPAEPQKHFTASLAERTDAYPFAGLATVKNGTLYGTTEYGGDIACDAGFGCGTVFEINPPAFPGGAWTESVIYAFSTFSYPLASPTVGPNGELYGTTYYGGSKGVGSVFELMPPSSPGGTWTETTLYSFSGAYGDPQNPEAGVVIGNNGVLYGTVQYAGLSPNCPESGYNSDYGCGAVFSLTPPASPGGVWTEQTLYTFSGKDGAVPLAGLAIGKNGELYGTTYFGGPSLNCSFYAAVIGCGTVFRLDPPASPPAPWTETVLYSFTGSSDGGYPNAVVYQDGVLYGTVTFGGDLKSCRSFGCGGVFELSPPASSGDFVDRICDLQFHGCPRRIVSRRRPGHWQRRKTLRHNSRRWGSEELPRKPRVRHRVRIDPATRLGRCLAGKGAP